MLPWLENQCYVDEVESGSHTKKALLDMHSGGQYSKRDAAKTCLSDEYYDFGYIRGKKKLIIVTFC